MIFDVVLIFIILFLDLYVRIFFVVDGKKVKRKKILVKRSMILLVWNEVLIFSIFFDFLLKCNFEVIVFDYDFIGYGEFVGWCIIGLN